MISVEQIRAARIMLNLKQEDLAIKAGISRATLNNIERGAQSDPKKSTLKAIQQVLEREGIEFASDQSGRIGVFMKPKNKASRKPTVLIVDDSKPDRILFKRWLSLEQENQYTILEAGGAREGFELFQKHNPDCIILDFIMYGTDGFQLLAAMKSGNTELPPIIFVTGMDNDAVERNAKAVGVHSYFSKKTLKQEDLCKAVKLAVSSI